MQTITRIDSRGSCGKHSAENHMLRQVCSVDHNERHAYLRTLNKVSLSEVMRTDAAHVCSSIRTFSEGIHKPNFPRLHQPKNSATSLNISPVPDVY